MKVVIDAIQKAKIDFWVDKAKGEVSGMGLVKAVGDTFYISEVYLLEQESASAETELDADAVARLMGKVYTPENLAKGSLNFWWHSHANMGVFWSQTDKNTMKQLSSGGWFLSTVFNKKGENKTEYRQANVNGYPEHIVEDVPFQVKLLLADTVQENLAKEFDEKVKEKVYVYNPPVGNTIYPHGEASHYGKPSWFDDVDDDNIPYRYQKAVPSEQELLDLIEEQEEDDNTYCVKACSSFGDKCEECDEWYMCEVFMTADSAYFEKANEEALRRIDGVTNGKRQDEITRIRDSKATKRKGKSKIGDKRFKEKNRTKR